MKWNKQENRIVGNIEKTLQVFSHYFITSFRLFLVVLLFEYEFAQPIDGLDKIKQKQISRLLFCPNSLVLKFFFFEPLFLKSYLIA